ncbi:MAG TPA: hypothetical protein VJ719_08075 [Chthoniobacterales bacterium]|nr:hypothetical protein [Chthoniobacterales bacterium]
MIKSIISIAFATALAGSVTYGQTSSSSTSTTVATGGNAVTETTTTTTTESTGVVTEYTPGQTLVLRTDAAEPLHYKFGKKVSYVTAEGRAIESSRIRKDSTVRVHYIKDGNDMLVDKVIITEKRD